ncbi:MAG: sugar phosphate isomerase/epimerase family protein [Actinomycetales bacterium]
MTPTNADTLFATCWTVAGDTAPDLADLRSPLSFAERAEAAAAAGFTGIGLRHEDLTVARDTYGWKGIRTILDDTGMREFEVEGLQDWWDHGPGRRESDAAREVMLAAAAEVGVRHLKVLPDTSLPEAALAAVEASGTGASPGGRHYRWDRDQWAQEFGTLAEQCAVAGARLALEFLPWSNLATLEDALSFVESAGHTGGGLILDVWHTERSHAPLSQIAGLPAERILGIELNDATAELVGSYPEDTMHRRRYCGDGDFDLVGFIRAVRRAGWQGSWGVEILSHEHRRLPVGEAALQAADTTRAVLAAAEQPS